MPKGMVDRERVYVLDRAAWRAWLEKHHGSSPGIWLVYDKVSARKERLAYADAVEEALCFGWIDSSGRPIDDRQYMQFFAPRKPKSTWSKVNKERIGRLTRAKLMHSSGRKVVAAAKKSGAWTSLDAVEALEMPADLGAALAKQAKARKHFDAFPAGYRKMFLHWVTMAKRPETRANRVREVVECSSRNQKVRNANLGRL